MKSKKTKRPANSSKKVERLETERRRLDELCNIHRQNLSALGEIGTGWRRERAIQQLRAERDKAKSELKQTLSQREVQKNRLDQHFNKHWGRVFKQGRQIVESGNKSNVMPAFIPVESLISSSIPAINTSAPLPTCYLTNVDLPCLRSHRRRNPMSLKDKTLFITGASRGIGLAIALRAAKDGANIAIAAKDNRAASETPRYDLYRSRGN